MLEQLGHVFEVQPTLQTSQGTKRPDYAFFPSADAHDAAQSHVNTNQLFKTALAIGDAKAWSRNLDGKARDKATRSTIKIRTTRSISTCGERINSGHLDQRGQWRLYHRQTSYRLDRFYEVDLAALLTDPNGWQDDLTHNEDFETFRYFYCLFRRDAFTPDASGASFLDLVLTESQEYTIAISDDLKNRVYDALRLLIGGFLDSPRNRFDKANPPLDEIHTNLPDSPVPCPVYPLRRKSRTVAGRKSLTTAAHYSLAALAGRFTKRLTGAT